ncbi:MAG TPA: IS3 family transposase [Bryobacteraceae bacterium]|nr:IS3 family transposase [Bryobacteraceae bacterium]
MLAIARQCELLDLPRSSYYYTPQGESAANLRLMRRIDQLYLARPFFGSRKMAVELGVNRKRVQRLMRLMDIEAHYAKPRLSQLAPGHTIYPYLLRGVAIEAPNQSSRRRTSRRRIIATITTLSLIYASRVPPRLCTGRWHPSRRPVIRWDRSFLRTADSGRTTPCWSGSRKPWR